jgi:hypothetical protein
MNAMTTAVLFGLAFGSVGCGGPSASKAPETNHAPVTDENACARLCDRMQSCGGAPQKCDERCERERAWLKPGFQSAFVACVEREVGVDVCTPPQPDRRAGAIALCYSATLDVFAARDQGRSAARVLKTTCERRARCNPDAKVDVRQCVSELQSRAPAAVLFLGVTRDEVIEQIDGCISASACDDADPVQRCAASALPQQKVPTP